LRRKVAEGQEEAALKKESQIVESLKLLTMMLARDQTAI
jgi:hypothetical protein